MRLWYIAMLRARIGENMARCVSFWSVSIAAAPACDNCPIAASNSFSDCCPIVPRNLSATCCIPRTAMTSACLVVASSIPSWIAEPSRKAALPAAVIACPNRATCGPARFSIGCTPGAWNCPISPGACGATCGTKVVGTVGMGQIRAVETPVRSSSMRRLRAQVEPMSVALPRRLVPSARPG